MRMTNTLTAILACVMFAVTLHAAELAKDEAATPSIRAGEQINWQVVSSGGTKGSSASFGLQGTVGQTAVGSGSSTSYGLGHGYWQPLVSSGDCCDIRADIDHNGSGPDIADLVYMVNFMFNGGPEPPCNTPDYLEADVDGNGTGPDIGDLVYLVNYMFNGGPAPIPCP